MIVDGEKFLAKIGISGKGFTSEDIRDALMKLGKGEVEAILVECSVQTDRSFFHNDFSFADLMNTTVDSCLFKPEECIENMYTEPQLKRLIKYERNPMRKKQLQRELSTMNSWNGKHRKGRA